MNRLNKQSGISLVEILVSLVISLFLLAGIVQVYMGNKVTFAFTGALAEIQENGRFALDTMSQDLRLAGEWGCVVPNGKAAPDNNINNTLSAATVTGYTAALHDFDDEESIEGTNNDVNGSDTLTLRGGKPGQTNVENPFQPDTNQTLITNAVSSIAVDDIVLVARCGTNDLATAVEADIYQIDSILPFSGNTQRQFGLSSTKSQQFQNDASVIELQTVTYTIAAGASGEPALWRSEFGNNQELIEGVEEMQILYGIDTDLVPDDFPNQYVTSDIVPDFGAVVAVRVGLLVRSLDDFVAEVPQTYTFNGATVTPTDRRIRQVFTTTIALRNRIGSP